MADGVFPGLVSATRDVNAQDNPIFVQLTDGTTVLNSTGGSLDVNITGGGGGTQYAVDDVAGATDLGMLALLVRDDALTTLTPADGDYVQGRVDSVGALWVNFTNTTIAVTATNLDIRDLAFASDKVDVSGSSVTVTATNLDIRDLVFATDKVDVSGSSVTVSATDLDIRDLTLAADAVRVSGNSSANSLVNPIFVQVVKTSVMSNEIHNYATATPAGDAASNHDYTVAGTTFLLSSVIVSCSGAMKAEIQTGPVGSLVTKAVVFLNARQGDTKQVFFDPPIEVPVTSTGTVRVIRTNRNSSATDVYSTIIGNDVA